MTSTVTLVAHETRVSADTTETQRRSSTGVALVTWVALVLTGSALVYVVLVAPGVKRLDAVPLHGALDPHVGLATLAPVAVAAVVILGARRLATLEWRALLGCAWAGALAWAVALASVRGWHRVSAPFGQPQDYLAVLDRIQSPMAFLGSYVERLPEYPVHVQGHPPGFVLLAWGLRAVGLGGPVPLALLCVAAGAVAAPLTLVVVRNVAGEDWARRAAPFLVLAPAALWMATSADALFAGVGAGAVALLVVATGRAGPSRDRLAAAGGGLFGLVAMLSYGLVLLAVIPAAVALQRRALRPMVVAAAGGAAVLAPFAIAGFSWVDGLEATRDRYFAGIASRRPYELFVVANLAILAIALGPAVAAGLARLRDRGLWLVVGAGLVAIALADLSGMSKSEIERIWLPFMPFVLVAAAALVPRADVQPGPVGPGAAGRPVLIGGTGWLVAQAGLALTVETVVRTAW